MSAVITGMGIVCSIGQNQQQVRHAVCHGVQSISPIRRLSVTPLSVSIGGEVDLATILSPQRDAISDPYARFAYHACMEAIHDSGISLDRIDPVRIGLVFGTCNGNIASLESMLSGFQAGSESLALRSFDHVMGTSPDHFLSAFYGYYQGIDFLNSMVTIMGPKAVFVTACSASHQAMGYAMDLIHNRIVDVVLVGGADSFSYSTFAGFHNLHALSDAPTTPFGSQIGLSLGEGAAFLVLEHDDFAVQRDATIKGRLLGYGFNSDAYHMTRPDQTGQGAIHCMRRAIQMAQIGMQDIDFVCAHGTGTLANDRMESQAIESVFGDQIETLRVTSTKAMHGHTLGASGVIQSVICLLAMSHDCIPAIPGLSMTRQGCDLWYVRTTDQRQKTNYFLSNGFAFGGNNVSIVVGGPTSKRWHGTITPIQERVVITGFHGISPLLSTQMGPALLSEIRPLSECPDIIRFDRFEVQDKRYRRFRIAPRIVQLGIEVSHIGVQHAQFPVQDIGHVGVFWGCARGPICAFESYYDTLITKGLDAASPRDFPQIVFNSVAGQVAIALGMTGPNTTVAGQFSPFLGLEYATQLIQHSQCHACLVGGADELGKIDTLISKSESMRDHHLSEGAAVLMLESLTHARQRQAPIWAEILGVSCTSSMPSKRLQGYQICVDMVLDKVNRVVSDIDLYMHCFGGENDVSYPCFLPEKTVLIQSYLGTLESATSLLAIIYAIIGNCNVRGSERPLIHHAIKTVLIGGSTMNGTHYAVVLKRGSVCL